jgi:hypothetical protein
VLASLLRREEGIGVVTALMVSFIVFSLGTVWYAVTVHELDEVVFDRNRTQAIHAADAGAREAMYLLSTAASTVRDAANGTGEYTAGVTGGTCDLVALQSVVEGVNEVVGEYWFRITDSTPSDTEDFLYHIEAWGWGPAHTARQATVKQVDLEVRLSPQEGFTYGLFAAGGGISLNNRKEIHGDVYSALNVSLSNDTDILDNGSFPGDGNVEIYGTLSVSTGADIFIEGRTTTNGYINHDSPDDRYVGDVIVVEDRDPPNAVDAPGNDAYFRQVYVGGVVRLGGTLKPGSDLDPYSGTDPVPVIEDAVGLEPVPLRSLPSFTWVAADYSPSGVTYATWNDFLTYYNANKTSPGLSGAHYVQDTGSYTWNLLNAKFADDFVLVVDGKLAMERAAGLTATAPKPVDVVVVANRTDGRISTGLNLYSSEDLRFLIYSKGEFSASNLTTIYGAVYAEKDVSNQKLILFYRPIEDELTKGFAFADEWFRAEPGVWREVPPGVDNTGILDPDGSPTYHCTLP